MRTYVRDIAGYILRISIILLVTACIARSGYGQTDKDSLSTVKGDSLTATASTELSRLSSLVDSSQIQIDLSALPAGAMKKIQNLNFRGIDIRDLLRGLGLQYNLNLLVDDNITREATIRLSGIPVIEAVITICKQYGLQLRQVADVFQVHKYTPPKPNPPKPNIIVNPDSTITMDFRGDQLSVAMRALSKKTNTNIVVRNGVDGPLNGFLQKVPFKIGLRTILSNNGFSLHEKAGIYIIDRMGMQNEKGNGGDQRLWINVKNHMISMDVANAPITHVIREISYQTNINLVTYNLPKQTITARTSGLSLEQTLSYLLRGTNYTYRKEGNIYIIGDKKINGIATTKLIRLKHIRADEAMKLIPDNIKKNASIEVVKEQNGLLVIGTSDVVSELESFVNAIDYPTPQILIQALVVDVSTSNVFELGATLAGSVPPDSSYYGSPFAIFGTAGANGKLSGGFEGQGTGRTLNRIFGSGGNLFGIHNLGVLPNDFFFRIQALDQQGKVNIQSRPQISTLNGHTASIQIGTTQYFLLKTTTPIQSPQNVVTQESERFETIKANVSLKITPWVSASGEVTAEIHPEFNTPVGTLNPNVPPTINNRVLDSTVRLKDGETIILGGLIQDSDTKNYNKIPILGDIPLIGKLFSNRSRSRNKSELIIFITPHVFFGDGTDAARWEQLSKEMDLDPEIGH